MQTKFAAFTGLAPPKPLTIPSSRPAATYGRCGAPHTLSVEARSASRREQTEKRHRRVRGKVEGSPERPRLAVFRSNSHIYAQVIDDAGATTLAAASTLTPEIREKLSGNGSGVEAAKLVGHKIAELCKQKNIEMVCFDRGGFLYHGRVQALADAAREGGLSF